MRYGPVQAGYAEYEAWVGAGTRVPGARAAGDGPGVVVGVVVVGVHVAAGDVAAGQGGGRGQTGRRREAPPLSGPRAPRPPREAGPPESPEGPGEAARSPYRPGNSPEEARNAEWAISTASCVRRSRAGAGWSSRRTRSRRSHTGRASHPCVSGRGGEGSASG